MLKSFDELLGRLRGQTHKKTVAIAAAACESVIEAAVYADKQGIARPLFVGDAAEIKTLLQKEAVDAGRYTILHSSAENAGAAAVAAVRSGQADFLMKGMLDTSALLRPVVAKENGLYAGGLMSHIALYEIPGYHKLLCSTDGGMVLSPTLAEKVQIVRNAVAFLQSIGCTRPTIAALAAVEKVHAKMPETTDAAALAGMNRAGKISGCVLEGPLSYDIAMSAQIAAMKGCQSEHCGNFDVLLAPNMVTGNIMGKAWSVTAGARMAGVVTGARVPIVLSSRGSSAAEKSTSIALAALSVAGGNHAG